MAALTAMKTQQRPVLIITSNNEKELHGAKRAEAPIGSLACPDMKKAPTAVDAFV